MTSNPNLLAQKEQLVTDLSIRHIVKYPKNYNPQDTEKKYPLIIAFHGHGSNEKDLISLADHLPPNLFWISGQGPQSIGVESYDWYQLPPTPEKIAATLNTINEFIEQIIKKYPIDPNQIYLLGFSQGSMVSLAYTMAYPKHVAGAIIQSGALATDIGLKIDTAALKKKPIIITHGIEDPMMPISRAIEANNVLNDMDIDVELHKFHMGHSISNESLSAVNTWLKQQLK